MNIPAYMLAASIALIAQRESNEVRWRNSIEADINNGAPANRICSSAMSSASVSDDVPFKNWAYGVARSYCEQGEGPTKTPKPEGEASRSCPPITMRQQSAIERGQRVFISGGDCSMMFNDHR